MPPHDPDAPLYEHEIPGEYVTVRATVDDVDGDLWSCLTMEPENQDITQLYLRMNGERWLALRDICDDVLATLRSLETQDRQAA
jgi:hypothetical protein